MRLFFSVCALALGVAILATPNGSFAADPSPAPAETTPASTAELLRALAAVAEQQQAAQTVLQQLREQASASRSDAERAAARLESLERTLAEQREAQLAALRDAQRQTLLTLRLASGLAVVMALGGFVLAALFLRVFRRMDEVSGRLTTLTGGGAPPRAALKSGGGADRPAGLATVVGELEKRVRELESSTAKPGLPVGEGHGGTARAAASAEAGEIQTLIAKGKELLAAGNAQEALDCFDAVLRFEGTHIEALVRQGRALEALGRTAEAVESYERALAVDASLAAAFLGKGGVVSLLEHPQPAHG
jgi:tetratricopeptide (TPR) repeat protein